jgi:predicted nucleic-acid-binding protein
MFYHGSLSCFEQIRNVFVVQVSLVEVVRLLLETALIRLELVLKVCNALQLAQLGGYPSPTKIWLSILT